MVAFFGGNPLLLKSQDTVSVKQLVHTGRISQVVDVCRHTFCAQRKAISLALPTVTFYTHGGRRSENAEEKDVYSVS